MGYLASRLGKDQPTAIERQQIILALRDAILARCSPVNIIIFGSILSDHFTYASDIDCAVIFADRSALAQGRKRLYAPPVLLDIPYDFLLYEQKDFAHKTAEGGICQVIQETGQVIYDQKSEV